MNKKRWTDEQKFRALTIAETTTISEAAKQTSVPAGTIKRWRSETNPNRTEDQNRTPKKLKDLQRAAMERAVDQAGEYIVERLKTLTDKLYGLAEAGVIETKTFMAQCRSKDRDSAAWLRAVVGAMHYGIHDAQLLAGKPTARPEMTNRHEYDITQRIITDPEALDLADSLLRRASGRDSGPFRLHGERRTMDTI
jgi:transposase-like protein